MCLPSWGVCSRSNSIARLKARIRTDSALDAPQARCGLYYRLFASGFGGNEYFDQAEYEGLGCKGYVPAARGE